MEQEKKIQLKLKAIKKTKSQLYYLGFRRGIDAYRYSKITQVFMGIDVIRNDKEYEAQSGLFAGWLFINKLRLNKKC